MMVGGSWVWYIGSLAYRPRSYANLSRSSLAGTVSSVSAGAGLESFMLASLDSLEIC
jgi:hypothetical protein